MNAERPVPDEDPEGPVEDLPPEVPADPEPPYPDEDEGPDELATGENLAASSAAGDAPWPASPPQHGTVYGFPDPVHGVMMAAMTELSWRQFLQDFQTLRNRFDQLSAERIEEIQGRKEVGPVVQPKVWVPHSARRRTN